MHIYKICDASLWEDAERNGVFTGAGIDIEDGYIHLSTARQLAETARLHFHNRSGQVMVTVDADKLDIKWEPSRGGDLFPHLYQALSLDAVIDVRAMPLDDHGTPCPEGGFPKD